MFDLKQAADNEAPKTTVVGQNGRTISSIYGNSNPPVFRIEAQDVELNAEELNHLCILVTHPPVELQA
jgi:hypothetical protein